MQTIEKLLLLCDQWAEDPLGMAHMDYKISDIIFEPRRLKTLDPGPRVLTAEEQDAVRRHLHGLLRHEHLEALKERCWRPCLEWTPVYPTRSDLRPGFMSIAGHQWMPPAQAFYASIATTFAEELTDYAAQLRRLAEHGSLERETAAAALSRVAHLAELIDELPEVKAGTEWEPHIEAWSKMGYLRAQLPLGVTTWDFRKHQLRVLLDAAVEIEVSRMSPKIMYNVAVRYDVPVSACAQREVEQALVAAGRRLSSLRMLLGAGRTSGPGDTALAVLSGLAEVERDLARLRSTLSAAGLTSAGVTISVRALDEAEAERLAVATARRKGYLSPVALHATKHTFGA